MDVDGVVILEILTVSCFCVEYPASIQSISYSSWQCVKSCGTKRVDSKSHLIKKTLIIGIISYEDISRGSYAVAGENGGFLAKFTIILNQSNKFIGKDGSSFCLSVLVSVPLHCS